MHIDIRWAIRRPWVVMPLVGVIGVGAWLALRSESTSADTNTPAETTAEASVGSMAQTVSAEGTLEPAQTGDLSFGAAGTVTAVNVEAGDRVRAGRVLATIDSAELELAVANAESSLAEAQATLAEDEDADASDDQLEADRSAVAAAQDSLDVAREDLDGARLVATFDGVVSAVNVVEGEQLTSGGTGGTSTTGSGSGSGGSASTLGSSEDTGLLPATGDTATDATTEEADIQVIDGDHFTVELGLDESDVDLVEVAQEATATVTTSSSTGFPGGGTFPGGGVFPGGGAFPGAGGPADTADADGADGATAAASGPTAEGLVWEVGRIADASSGVASYPVTVLFENTDGEFNAGETVSVEITYDEVQDVVQVPTLAVTTEEDGSSTVTVRTDDGDSTRTVETGLTSGTMTEITAGLDAGETVVMSFGGRGGTGGFPGGGDLPDDLPEGFPGADG
ncbi:MAG: biotin/lipoyl-binding protein [Acidimicrobiales bacterium]